MSGYSPEAKPFLKWVGGKKAIAPEVIKALGMEKDALDTKTIYYEPFLGGGAVFLELQNQGFKGFSFLGDVNYRLVNAWKYTQLQPAAVASGVQHLALNHSKELFYTIRKALNGDRRDSVQAAAEFIYLNRFCFNGVYRENSTGGINTPVGYVPGGKGKPPYFPTKDDLWAVADAMNRTYVVEGGYHYINDSLQFEEDHIIENNTIPKYIYCDPPYLDTYGGYNAKQFDRADHIHLAHNCRKWTRKGCRVVVSNTDNEEVRSVFALKKGDEDLGVEFVSLKNIRNVSAKASSRGAVDELLIIYYQR